MRLKLLLAFLPLLIHANSEDRGHVSYSHGLNIWNHAISHPSHQVPRPLASPSKIQTLAIPTDAPDSTTDFVKTTLQPYIPPRPTLRPWNPNIEGTTSRINDSKIEEHPNTLRPVQNRPSYVRQPLQPRPIPNPRPVRPLSIPDVSATTASIIEPNLEPEQTTTQRLISNWPNARPAFQFRPQPNIPVTSVSISEITTSSLIVEPTTRRPIQNLPTQLYPRPPQSFRPATTLSPNPPPATEPTVPIITSTITPDIIENQEGNVIPDNNITQLPSELPNPIPSTYAPYPASTGRMPFYRRPYPTSRVPLYPRPRPNLTRLPLRPEPSWQLTSTSVQPPIRQPLVPARIPTYQPPVTQKPVTLPPPIISNNEELLSGYSCAREDGYFGDVNECNLFVECRNNKAIRHMCPDDLYFNPNAIWPEYPCALPSEIQCIKNAEPSVPIITSTITPENPEESKNIVIPDNNIVELPTILPEPIPTTYAPFLTSTGRVPLYPRPRPNLTRLPLRPEPSWQLTSTSVQPPIRQPLVPAPIPTSQPLVTQKPVTLPPPIISNNEEMLSGYSCAREDGYFGDVNECNLFVECRNNKAIRHMCPDDLYFNPNAIWPEYPCALPSEVQCIKNAEPSVPIITSTITPENPDDSKDIVIPDNNIVELSTILPEPIPTTNAPFLTSTGRVPLYPRPNPTRLPLRPEPNWAISTTVRPPIRQSPIPEPIYTYRPPVSQRPVTMSPNPNGNGQPLPLQPPVISNDGEMLSGYSCARADGYFGYPNECDSFVECQKSVAVRYMCPDGLHFNPNTIWPEYPCAYPSEVQCNNNAVKQVPQPTADCPHRHGYFPMNDGECGRYIMCQEGLATIMNCPQGLVFNPEMSSCDWPENVPSCNPDVFRGFTCPAPTLDDNGEPSDEIHKFRHGESCNEYIACHRGHPRLLSCNPGFSFDKDVQACVASDYVQNCRA